MLILLAQLVIILFLCILTCRCLISSALYNSRETDRGLKVYMRLGGLGVFGSWDGSGMIHMFIES